MASKYRRFSPLITLTRIWAYISLIVLAGAFIATTVYGIVRLTMEFDLLTLVYRVLLALALIATGVGIWILKGLVEVLVSNESAVEPLADHLKRVESILTGLQDSNRRLIEISQLSDKVKSLVFHKAEISAINDLLHEHLMKQDYQAAEELVSEVEGQFGYYNLAEKMREEIASARKMTLEQRIDAFIDRISKLIEQHNWAEASRRARRLLQLAPDNPKVLALPQLINDARKKHKRDLLKAYDEAVRTGDIDRSIDLLRQLDKYLTPREAAALEDSARSVFRTKLHNLGVQFAVHVTDQDWVSAIEVGKQIVQEYPNSRMAQEVRQKMDMLQNLAAQQITPSSTKTNKE